MNQPKRNNPHNKAEGRSPKHPKKGKQIKQIKSRIFKNLNQFPIQLTHASKQNHPANHPVRPTSSLNHEQSHMHKALRNIRVESALSQYPEHRENHNRKRLSLDSTGKRYERQSLVSRNSHSKKMSKNSRHIEDGARVKIAEQRKRSNISFLSAGEDVNVKTAKKNSVKHKRQSFSNLVVQLKPKGKENKSPKNIKGGDKSRSKSKNRRKKSTFQLDKSKISASAATTFDKGFLKKKQSISAAQIGPFPKKKKKTGKRKSVQMQKPEQFSVQQYPINKYDASYTTQQFHHPTHHPRPAVKSRSKSRKGSTSKEPKKNHSLLEIDYSSCINIPSNSSGLINSHNSKQSRASNEKIKIIDNWQYRYFVEDNPTSFNMEEIRYFQSNHYSQRKQKEQFMNKKFNNEKRYNLRKNIEEEIVDEYPHFQQLELKFLSSVIFIQRKWREYRLYKQVFKNLATSDHKISYLNIQNQSNSKQLNICNSKSPQKTQKKEKKKTEERQISTSYSPKFKRELFAEEKNEVEKLYEQGKSLKNKAYLEYEQIVEEEKEYLSRPKKMEEEHFELQEQGLHEVPHPSSRQSSPLSANTRNYQFLTNQLFPSMSYLQLKQEQLKNELQFNLKQLHQLHNQGAITSQQYKKLKAQTQFSFDKEMKSLSKSRKDIKKGYLSFIDTYKDIKQENGLRRVSSQNGPMSVLYSKVYHLDKTAKNSSSSSESMKRLTKRVLIRKQFFQTQKIEPCIFEHSHKKSTSAREHTESKEKSSLSARVVKKPVPQVEDIGEEEEHLCFNRIKEGVIVSPEVYQISPTHSPIIETQPTKTNQAISTDPIVLEKKERLLLDQIIEGLTHQLFIQLIKIDEKRQNTIDIIIEPQLPPISKITESDLKQFEMVQDAQSLQFQSKEYDHKQEDFQIVEELKFRQIFKIEGLSERSDIVVNRKPRHSNTHNISPVSAEVVPFEIQEIVSYASQLFNFLDKKQIQVEVMAKLNKNQGFTPKQYLKFLRDFQIPDEQYDPLISNEIFIEWEQSFYENKEFPEQDDPYSKRQAITIFHRCVFQCIIGLLEDRRPSGDKGEPFPWEHVVYFRRSLVLEDIPTLYTECLADLQKLVTLKCGLIEQKQLVLTEEDMQRLHQQNEDRIITMLQNELAVSPHSWYQTEQHGLQIKLQLQMEVYEFIMLQALDEMLEIFQVQLQ